MEPINGFINVAERTNDESIKKILSRYAKTEIDDFIGEFIDYLRGNDYTILSSDACDTYDMIPAITLPDLQNAMFQFIWEYCKKPSNDDKSN